MENVFLQTARFLVEAALEEEKLIVRVKHKTNIIFFQGLATGGNRNFKALPRQIFRKLFTRLNIVIFMGPKKKHFLSYHYKHNSCIRRLAFPFRVKMFQHIFYPS